LGGFVQRGEQGGAEIEGRGYGACDVEERMESKEWKAFRRAGREMALIAKEMKRVRKCKEEIPQGG
jgi:hypothetical protein